MNYNLRCEVYLDDCTYCSEGHCYNESDVERHDEAVSVTSWENYKMSTETRAEMMAELRNVHGAGEKIVNVLTGETFTV